MLRRLHWFWIIIPVLLLSACAAPNMPAGTVASTPAAALPASPPSTCPITSPSGTSFIPPSPYSKTPPANYPNQFWFGTADLWTMLGVDGTWSGLPRDIAGYGQKLFWLSTNYDINAEPSPNLMVTGRRLDASGSVLTTTGATNAMTDFGPAMLIGIDIPTPGCWQITGSYKGHDLSFVVWVTS